MMKDNITTVGGTSTFPVEDISHKPKRMQGDSIRQKFGDSSDEQYPVSRGRSDTTHSSTLGVITLERAIPYYEEMADKDPVNSKLFIATAKWLKELLVTRSTKIEAAVKATFTPKEENNNDLAED